MSKWWEKKKEVASIWQACKTPDNLDYFFNTVTNETTWEKPDELMNDDEKDAAVNHYSLVESLSARLLLLTTSRNLTFVSNLPKLSVGRACLFLISFNLFRVIGNGSPMKLRLFYLVKGTLRKASGPCCSSKTARYLL